MPHSNFDADYPLVTDELFCLGFFALILRRRVFAYFRWIYNAQCSRKVAIFSAALAVLALSMLPAHATAQPCEVPIRLEGFGPGLSDYEIGVFELALAATADQYGPCKLIAKQIGFPFKRFWKELEKGKTIKGGISAGIVPQTSDDLIAMEMPFLGGALGLRKSIIRRENAQDFENTQTFEKLKTYRVGQVINWTDIAIYQAAEIPVFDTFDMKQLFRMLAHSRFDLIPLSILQVDSIFEQYSATNPELAIAEKTYIYYPIQTWFYFNKNDEELANRILTGFQTIFKNGAELQLFQKKYGHIIDSLKADKSRIYLLDSPHLSARQNQELTDKFLRRFGLLEYAVSTPASTFKAEPQL